MIFNTISTTQQGQGFQHIRFFHLQKIFRQLRVRSLMPKTIFCLVSNVIYDSNQYSVSVNLLRGRLFYGTEDEHPFHREKIEVDNAKIIANLFTCDH